MSTEKVLTQDKPYKINQSNYYQKEQEEVMPWEKMGIKYGLIAGFLMGLYLLAINWGDEIGMTWRFLKYLILGVVLAVALGRYKMQAPKFVFFKRGILLSAAISGISALVVGVMNLVVYAYAPDSTFQKFGLVTDSFADALTLSAVLLFEIFALGMILAFICLQYFKRNVRMR